MFWDTLPTEMKFAVVDFLDVHDVRFLGQVDHTTRDICIPTSYKTVSITSYEKLRSFVTHVPEAHAQHIKTLTICTKSAADEGRADGKLVEIPTKTDAVSTLLARCGALESLSLTLAGSLAMRIVPFFARLKELRSLEIGNWGDETRMPISERLVTSIALTVPNLTHLSLHRISRSASYAPELLGTTVPVCTNDTGILAPVDTPLSLPSVLTLPTLRSLSISETHLGDRAWTTAPVRCALERLDLGGSPHEAPSANQAHVSAVLANPGLEACATLKEMGLGAPLNTKPKLRALQTLNLSPQFPVAAPLLDSAAESPLQATLSALADSPLARLAVRCYADDAEDCRDALCGLEGLKVELATVPDEVEDAVRFPGVGGALYACCPEGRLAGVVTPAGFVGVLA